MSGTEKVKHCFNCAKELVHDEHEVTILGSDHEWPGLRLTYCGDCCVLCNAIERLDIGTDTVNPTK